MATLALAQDNAFGQPLESQLRSCLLATWICDAAGFDRPGARHRLLGGVAPLYRVHRSRARGRDALRRRDRDPRPDARARRRESGRGHSGRDQVRDRRPRGRRSASRSCNSFSRTRASGRRTTFRRAAKSATCCSNGIDFGPDVREALRFTFERWNGKGYPAHAAARRSRCRCASCT